MSSRRYELSDFEWAIIGPLLPNKQRGVPRVDDRRVLSGFGRDRLGQTYLSAMDLRRPAIIVLCVGERQVFGIGCLRQLQALMRSTSR
jgi:transposase